MPRNIAPYAKPVATIHAEAKNIRETPKLFGVVKMLIMKAASRTHRYSDEV